jgi:hypothetical protein
MKRSETAESVSGCLGIGIGLGLFMGLGVAQWMAIYAWVEKTLDMPWIISGGLTLLVSFLPIIGNICGTLGAINAWDWPWWAAVLLFFGTWVAYLPILLLASATSSLVEWLLLRFGSKK